MSDAAVLESALGRLKTLPRLVQLGRVTRVIGNVVEASQVPVAVGEVSRLSTAQRSVLAVVAGFHDRGILLLPIGEIEGIHPGAMVAPLGRSLYVAAGRGLIGRVLDGLGRPIDGLGPVGPTVSRSLYSDPPNPLERPPVARRRSAPACARSTGSSRSAGASGSGSWRAAASAKACCSG